MRLRSFCGAATKLYSAAIAADARRKLAATVAQDVTRRGISGSWSIRIQDITANPGGNSALVIAQSKRPRYSPDETDRRHERPDAECPDARLRSRRNPRRQRSRPHGNAQRDP